MTKKGFLLLPVASRTRSALSCTSSVYYRWPFGACACVNTLDAEKKEKKLRVCCCCGVLVELWFSAEEEEAAAAAAAAKLTLCGAVFFF